MNCIYCGEPAGFLRTKHAECEQKHIEQQELIQNGGSLILEEIISAINGKEGFEYLEKKILDIKLSHSIPDVISLLVKGWETAVENFLEDGILDEDEENRLGEFKNYFSLSQEDLNQRGALTKTAKAAVLRDILNGIIPERVSVDSNFPLNFQKNEKIVWAFPDSQYLEDKTRRQYVGGSQGVSIRIAKGLYYRTGTFKGHAVEHMERVHVDTGWVVITNKNIYFAGSLKSLRIPYEKIVSFEPYSDGIGVMRDTATAKPQVFVTGDGWFTYNAVTNLAQL